MTYKINVIKDDRLIVSYKSPIIPKHDEVITLLEGSYTVQRLGHIVYNNSGDYILSELDVFVS